MTVMILERVTPSLRGEVTRWLIQPKAGVFVGRLTSRVRGLLWEKVQKSARNGAAIPLYSDSSEQGFGVRSLGDTSKVITDFEGVFLPMMPSTAH